MEIQTLKSKWWYRLLKVIYIIAIVIAVIIIGFFLWINKPVKTLDGYKSLITCNNGKSYAPNRNDIYPYGYGTELNYSDDKDARILCKYDTLNFYDHRNEQIEKNYTFNPVYYYEISYGSWIRNIILSFLGLWFLANLIKGIFFYIITGQWIAFKFRKKSNEISNSPTDSKNA